MTLVLIFALSLAGCKSAVIEIMNQSSSAEESSAPVSSSPESSEQESSSDDANVSPEDKLDEIYDYVIDDLWNDGFRIVDNYVTVGNDENGNKISSKTIDNTLLKLKDTMDKKVDYDSFIQSLEDKEYDDVREKWKTLSDEADLVYIGVRAKKLVANDKSPKVNPMDFDLLDQYVDDFTDAIDSLTDEDYDNDEEWQNFFDETEEEVPIGVQTKKPAA
jgi:hypothetical protein